MVTTQAEQLRRLGLSDVATRKPRSGSSARPELGPGDSPLAQAVARVGDRWTLLVVDALREAPRRFNDLLDALPGIASNVLSQRLKHLEAEGVIVSRPYQTRPPRDADSPARCDCSRSGARRSRGTRNRCGT